MTRFSEIFNKYIFHPIPSKVRDSNKFFLTDKEGISLSTCSGRLLEFDEWIFKFLKNDLIFGDFGAASGITTLDFHEKAIKNGFKIESYLIDRTLTLERYSRFPFNIFRNNSGFAIQFFFLKIPLIYLNSKRIGIPQIKKLITSFVKNENEFYSGNFSIADNKVKNFIKSNRKNKIFLKECDFTIFNSKFENKFNLIRFAHSLDYFYRNEPKKLIQIFMHTKKYLKNNSFLLLIIQDSNASLFRLKDNNFYLEDRLGKGAKLLEEFLEENGFINKN